MGPGVGVGADVAVEAGPDEPTEDAGAAPGEAAGPASEQAEATSTSGTAIASGRRMSR